MSGYRLEDGNILKSVFLSYFILGFHVVLLGFLGVMILFFNTIAHYFIWILLFSAVALTGSGLFLLRYIRRQRLSFSKILSLPELKGRSIEVNLLGGFASIKISGENIPADSGLMQNSMPGNLIDISEFHGQPKKRLATDYPIEVTEKESIPTKKERLP